jgi:LacI family sucrose operon transcriptional repressor
VVLVGGPRSQFAAATTFPTIRYHLTVERLLADAGIACDYVEAGAVADIAAHEATACAIFEQYPDVDAIVGSDVVASVALQEASRRGIEVPADLQVIAYDGTLMAETAGKRLTAIRQDFPAIAAALAVRMDSQIAADGGPASPSKNDSASDVDTQPTPEEVIPVALIPGETTR